jgi:hypothetical protein
LYQSKSGGGPFTRDPKVDKKPKPLTPGNPSPNPQTTAPVQPTESATTQIENTTNDAMQNLVGRVGNMQPFQPTMDAMPQMPQMSPQEYSAMRQRAEQTAMDSFDRNMGPQFQREEADFRQRMAEQGVPETSEGYQKQYQDMKNAQNSARQNAMSNAFQLGQGEQAQAYGQQAQNYQLGLAGRDQQFNQGIQQYRLPMEQLGAMTPVYGQMSQNQQFGQRMTFDEQQAELQRQHDEAMAGQKYKYDRGLMRLQYKLNPPRGGGGGGGGGGGMSMQDRMALMDREFYNQMALQAGQTPQQMPNNSLANNFLNGVANTTPLIIGGMLAR